jgi:hypothetical protein
VTRPPRVYCAGVGAGNDFSATESGSGDGDVVGDFFSGMPSDSILRFLAGGSDIMGVMEVFGTDCE